MTHQVLVVGIDPAIVDFSAPGFPPGLTADRIRQELARLPDAFAGAGLDATLCMLRPDDTLAAAMAAALGARRYDCVVIGGGIRTPPDMVEALETIVDAVRRHAPDAAIAFNATPQDSVRAAQRRLGRG